MPLWALKNEEMRFMLASMASIASLPATSATTANSYSFQFSECNPNAGANLNNCTGTANLPVGIGYTDTNYNLVCNVLDTGGRAAIQLTVTGFTTAGFDYTNTVIINNGTHSQPNTIMWFVQHQ
jgi:hypothetical protein